ncbi:MAG: DUF3298 and DUF4163 domain-containing protein [Treponema sp.]|jgi:hypothetical protein|nr:DUF3298 and DUF4163 domain-containing protein [Treponema sp.]
MKKKKRVFLPVVAAVALLASCRSGPETAGEAPEISAFKVEETIILEPERNVSPETGGTAPRMRISLSIPVLSGAGEAGPLQQLIQNALYKGMDPRTYAGALITDFKSQYHAAWEDYGNNQGPGEIFNWEYTETWESPVNTPLLLVLSREKEYYLGGAHGMREQLWLVLDREKSRHTALADIVPDEKQGLLAAAALKALREKAGLKEGEPLSQGGYFEGFVLTENFYLLPGGMGFHWDPYEIAPYSHGPVDIVIPYRNIRDLLTPWGLILAEEARKRG